MGRLPSLLTRNEMVKKALSGIRVLDLTTNIAGPCATMILADLGADVIKVERPDGGDDARHMRPHLGDWGAYFVAINRGKRSIAVDLRQPAGKELIFRLIGKSDVFVESFRGGKAASLGFDEKTVRQKKPAIVYASLTAYGPSGPEFEKPGYDSRLQGRTGILSVTGTEVGDTVRAGVSILDMGSGMWLALGILAALLKRQRGGEGQKVDTSLFQTGVMWMAYHLLYYQFTGVDPSPQGTRHLAFAPYGDFPTSDGRVLIGISNDRLFSRLCRALGDTGWDGHSRFSTNPARVQNRVELDQKIGAVLRQKSSASWLRIFDQTGVPASPLQRVGQLLDDAQLAALGQLEEVYLSDAQGQPVRLPRLPLELSESPPEIGGPPPQLGQHSREILSGEGLSEAEIADLIRSGVVRLAEPRH